MVRPGTFDRVSAVIAAAGAVVVGGWFVVVGVQTGVAGGPGRGPVDRVFPFLLAALAVAVFGLLARRSWRLAGRADAAPQAVRPAAAPAGDASSTLPDAVRVVPPLSAQGRERLHRILDVLTDARVLPPAVADPDLLASAVADHGEPVTSGTVLGALDETAPGGWDALLAHHPTWGEQLPDVVRGTIDDLDRLAGPDHRVVLAGSETGGGAVRLTIEVDGRAVHTEHPDHPKAVGTAPHVAVARALRAGGAPRLAWLWTDQTLWVAAPALSPAELNDVLDQPVHELWQWIDEAPGR